ncbi:hypothetical protein N9Q27_00680 [bacterium]|jgi:hypothetical protein|nr:hypothetical protein [bacterium]
MLNAQEVIKDRFWIIKSDHGKVGTLRSCDSGYEFFDQRDNTTRTLDSIDELFSVTAKEGSVVMEDIKINGFTTGLQEAHAVEYKHYPAYTKTANATALYGAGYYIINFHGTGWQWAYNPKIKTLESYESKGPYQTEWESNLELKKHRRS